MTGNVSPSLDRSPTKGSIQKIASPPIVPPIKRTRGSSQYYAIDQDPIIHHRTTCRCIQIILERYTAAFPLHAAAFIFSLYWVIRITFFDVVEPTLHRETAAIVLLVYAAFDVFLIIATNDLFPLTFRATLVDATIKLSLVIMTLLPLIFPIQLLLTPSRIILFIFLCFFLCVTRYLAKFRLLVCVNKRVTRDEATGATLDLSYLNTRTIAMAVPAAGIDALWRNRIEDVSRFFQRKYPNSHLVVNMCDECAYPSNYFHRVEYCPTPDHEVPTIEMMIDLCEKVEAFMSADPNSVVAFHCKGGKGRTGLVSACWLLYSGFCETAIHAIQVVAERRTEPLVFGGVKTVTQACQIRFLRYFEDFLKKRADNPTPISQKAALIRSIKITGLQKLDMKRISVRFRPHPRNRSTWRKFDTTMFGQTTLQNKLGEVMSGSIANGLSVSVSTPATPSAGTATTWVWHHHTPPEYSHLIRDNHDSNAVGESCCSPLLMCRSPQAGHLDSELKESAKNGNEDTGPAFPSPSPVKGLVCVEVVYRTRLLQDVLAYTWLHADFLGVPQLDIKMRPSVTQNRSPDADRVPLFVPGSNSERGDLFLPLIGKKDFDGAGSHSSMVKGLRMDMQWEYL